MGCGDSFVKYVLFFFNLIFALCGLAILGVGIAFKVKFDYITDLLDNSGITVQPILFIVIGSIVFIVSFFGCCGAVRESHCMLVTYAIFMIIIIILQVVLAIVIFVYIGDISKAIEEGMRASFSKAWKGNEEVLQGAWNVAQEQLHCCGVTSFTDYVGVGALPPSSCGSIPYGGGCLTIIADYMKTSGTTIAGIAIGVAVIEIITVIFSLCFANTIRNAERRSRY